MKATKPTSSNLNETNQPALAHMLGSPSRIAESANPMQRVLTACLALFALSIIPRERRLTAATSPAHPGAAGLRCLPAARDF